MTSNLETLAVEIKYKIFSHLTRIADLQSLVHASAPYYRTYISDGTREKVLTDLTLSELKARDVNFFHPVPFLEICLRDRARLGPETENAIVEVRAQKKAQIRARGQGRKVIPPIKLSVAQCVALLNVEDVLPWGVFTYDKKVRCCFVRGDEYLLQALGNGRKNYYAMTDSPFVPVKWSRGQYIRRFQHAADREFRNRVRPPWYLFQHAADGESSGRLWTTSCPILLTFPDHIAKKILHFLCGSSDY